jgi:hypothetical protein
MFSIGGGFDPFSWGAPRFSFQAGNNAPEKVEWWEKVAGVGSGVMNSIFGYKLQSQQIKAGQTPSIGYDPATGRVTGQPVTYGVPGLNGSSWLMWLLLILGVVLVFKMVK